MTKTRNAIRKVSPEDGGGPLYFGSAWGGGLSLRPREEFVQRRAQGLPALGQVVLDLRRHLCVDDARDDAVALELPKLLDQHLL
jgi:hypothetical protein